MKRGAKNKKTLGLCNPKHLTTVCHLLNEKAARYLVIGGMAANLHGLLRATKDIDLLIPKGDIPNTEKILEALGGLTWGIAKELDANEVSKKPFTIIGDTPRVDLLTVAHRVNYEEAEKRRMIVQEEGTTIPYVDLETLLKTKDTGRLQDKADQEKLRLIARKKKK